MLPSNQLKLYGLDIYFSEIIDLFNMKKLPNKILLNGKKGLGKSTLAYHLINYILSRNEENKYDAINYQIQKENKSYKLINNHSHPNFYLIDILENKKNIEISQIRNLILYTNKSSLNDLPRIILIDNIEKLNTNSVNALLKVIEEPNDDVYFILINNNTKKIPATLKSRCIVFQIMLTFKQSIDISNSLLGKDLNELINKDLIYHYNTPGDFINLINFATNKKINLKDFDLTKILHYLIDNNLYKKDPLALCLIYNFIELYFLKIYKNSKTKKEILYFYYKFIDKVKDAKRFNLDQESLFLEFKSKLLNG